MDAWLKNFWAKINADIKDLWNNNKIFFIIFGILILIVKFRDILINILVSGGKAEMDKATKQDEKLAVEENKAKTDADKLVEQAKEELNKEKPVDENWNKK